MPRPPFDDADPERLRSVVWLRFFERALTRRLRTSFHALRLAKPGLPAIDPTLPLIVYANHPSWWDGAFMPVLVMRLFRSRRAFGPIDGDALQRYGFMRRLGFFGVQSGTYAGAATFLRVGRRVLAQPDTVFVLTPEGSFNDTRQRPVRLMPGLAGLIASVPRVSVLPLAVEYPFWSESKPEALARFGEPVVMGAGSAGSLSGLQQTLEANLSATMDELAADAVSRDAARFEVLLEGSAGIGGVYDAWRRVKAWGSGQRFDPAHMPTNLPARGPAHGPAHRPAHVPAPVREKG